MDYRDDIKQCYSAIMQQESFAVQMHITMGVDIRPLAQTLDLLKIVMVYAWEHLGYGTYKDFFKGKELETKYLSLSNYSHSDKIGDFRKFLKQFRVRTLFDDDMASLAKMEEIVEAIA